MATPTRPMTPAPAAKPMTPAPVNQARPMTPAPARPAVPVKPTVAPTPAPMSPAAKLAAENKAVIDKANLNPNRQGSPLLIEKDAMKAALDKNQAIRQATDARLKAEAKANVVPPSQDKYAPIKRMMDAVQARSSLPVARAPVPRAKGGTVKSASARADGIAIRGKTRA